MDMSLFINISKHSISYSGDLYSVCWVCDVFLTIIFFFL